MTQTRRGFLKFIGKVMAVSTVAFVAPSVALAKINTLDKKLPAKISGFTPRKSLKYSLERPMTATEVLNRRSNIAEEMGPIFSKHFNKTFLKLSQQRGLFLEI